MSIVFFLDDKRNPNYKTGDTYIVARSYSEAIDIIDSYPANWDVWTLDHDLGDDPKAHSKLTGYDFLKWAAENALTKWPRANVRVHSANPVGRKNMEAFIAQVEKHLL